MLEGTITYRDTHGRRNVFNVEGVDNSVTLSLTMESYDYDTMLTMESEGREDFGRALSERRVDVGISNIKVSTALSTNEEGKKVKEPVNADLFCRLGALLRYVKSNCSTRNELGYTGLSLASGEFEQCEEKEYEIKFPTDESKTLATVTLCYDSIAKLQVNTDIFDISLEDNNPKYVKLFPAIKNGWTSGLRFNEESLGFKQEEKVIKDSSSSEGADYINDGLYHSIEEIIEANPDKEFSWLLGKDYRIVTDETLDEVFNYIMEDRWGYVYYDTETTGLNINFKSRTGQADQLVGVVLSVKFGESFFFPTQMNSIANLCGGDHFYFMQKYMKPILERKKLVAHNAPFDWKVGYIYDINCNIVHDTMAILHLTLGAERKNYKVGLKSNAKLLLGRDSLELSDLVRDNSWGENSDITFADLPEELVRLYACADTDNTNGLLMYAEQADLLSKYNAKKIYEIELAFGFAVAYQEFYGHRIDITNLEKVRADLGEEQKKLLQTMFDICGHEFNPNSPKQLQTVLYEELGIPKQYSRKTGNVTTDGKTLEKLASITDINDEVKYPFCKYLLQYRQLEGVRKTVDKFPEHMTPDGYIFSDVQQYGTTTGRVSIKNPNYQSYNDPIKKNVIPRPGFWMFDTDYSSVEYRVLGNMVGNKRIMESFKDPDFDYHAYQAARMNGVPYSAVTKKMRKAAKGINFGLPYGMGDASLGVQIFGEESAENTRKAGALRTAYFKGQEDIRDWFEYHRDRGVNEGFTETYFGRRRYYHKSDFSVNAIRRQAGNQVIQGCQDLNTRILTKEFGIVRLGDVLNTNVTVWDGIRWSNGDVLPAGNKRKTVIKFKGGQTMICSPTHKFLVSTRRGNTMWVEAQDLHTTSEYRNPHRILVNPQHAVADYVYKSDRKYDCHTSNANNVYLSDVNDSYKVGIILGRLASDGHQTLHHSGSNAIVQIIAEHEYNILPKLKECLENLGYYEDSDGTREDRNEEITRLTVYSTSLSKEINELDIRHKIHKNIFMDTELLRGFLCGYFDGDGGISGKAITCVFGKQDDFQTLVEDMQKALLFFGVRSRIREYDDRWVLQIKTNDNELFLKEIGFLNSDKQIAGSKLHCIEEEKTFGRCIIPESVEVTDELIPMADVCNTDGGYYVADGIVTHNTAADIYKTAVGRVFNRICKEGWLGKVMFTGFIHDELLGEVSNDINPAVFLKVLREEFEVKVKNDDGSDWCPLYMGFGYGMNWYEAKSVELPIKLQWEIVEKYGDNGFPEWDGDGRKFCDTVPDKLRDFEVRDIRNQMISPEAQGKEIKVTLNNQILGCVKEDAKEYSNAISDYITESGDYAMIQSEKMQMSDYLDMTHDVLCKYLDKHIHIQDLYKDENGNYVDTFEPAKTTQDAITQYCMLHGVDRNSINLLDIEEVDTSARSTSDVEGYLDYSDEEEADSEAKRQALIDSRVFNLGLYMDVENKEIYLRYVPTAYMNLIRQYSNKEQKGYRIYFKDFENNKLYKCDAWLESANIHTVQDIYLSYFKNLA